MTLEQTSALGRYWLRSPPAHELLAAHVGYKPPDDAASPTSRAVTQQDRQRLAALERKWGLA